MAEYIEREALMDRMEARLNGLRNMFGNYDHYTDGFEEGLVAVEDAETADVVEVVRCKDCLFYKCDNGCPLHESGYFKNGKMLPFENDFCSYGERRVEDTE